MVFATLLIVAGCGGEYLFGGRASDAAAQMQSIEQVEIANAQQKANDAAAEAAKLGVTVDNLTQVAQTKAGEANLAIAALTEATAQAAGKVAAIEKTVTPRDLSPEQQKRIWERLSAENAVVRYAVFSTTGVFESAHLADEIAKSLTPDQSAKDVNRYPVTYGEAPYSIAGVGILASDSAKGQRGAEALARALSSEGISAFVLPTKGMKCAEIDSLKAVAETDPACSAISVEVGDHP